MKTKPFSRARAVALVLVAGGAVASPAAGQALKNEMVWDLEQVADKYLALAGAIPVSDYTWRPGEGVRSVGEVFMHIVSANFGIPGIMGATRAEIPEGWARGDAEGLDPEAAVEALRASFDYVVAFVEGLDESQIEGEVTVFGRPTDGHGFLILLTTHLHEHLGQAIAYARVRGVVPPWSS
ncbi:MAG: DinB family protein [Gemmatimonadota bacterium]|nr:DinB family protein [Gemmatimonadota bacterium]MDH5759749.1 DinB family protein [Gemmatimonadota bacterium]